MTPEPPAAPVGLVQGTLDATPLEFWVAVAPGQFLQLDDVVATDRAVPGTGEVVATYGVVTDVRARHVGARFDSDVFLIADGALPAEVVEAACVSVTRVDPETFIPPLPGAEVRRAVGAERDKALAADGMEATLVAGATRDGEPAVLNLQFVDGSRGAHVNISGISGVATKTTYATFLLHALFTGGQLGADAHNTKALVFNVKGEDLLFLDRPNARLTDEDRAAYLRLGLPPLPFASVDLWAPPRKGDPAAAPAVTARVDGVRSFFWGLDEFCAEQLLPFAFAEAEDDRQQLGMVVANVARRLTKDDVRPIGDGGVDVCGRPCRTFAELADEVAARCEDPATSQEWAGRAIAAGTVGAFVRRLFGASEALGRLVRGDVPGGGTGHRIDRQGQVTVVDIHDLTERAKRFVVGATVRRAFQDKEATGTNRPLLFVVLDELNKYAPREGYSPIKEVLLDIAERGRSLGVILIGCQQTASEVERRIVANSAIRVVGRLDPAEAGREEYGFLAGGQRQRATILQPGTMVVAQPQLPVPLVVRFPFPAWATRSEECPPPAAEDDDELIALVVRR